MEVVLVHLAKNAEYKYGLPYVNQKTVHFVHDMEDFEKITDTEAWQKIEYCIHMLNESQEKCFEIVQVNGSSAKATTIFKTGVPWKTAFVKGINYGDCIEIRFRGNVIRGPIQHFEMRQIRVNLPENEIYSSDVSYHNRTTCEYTHYYYLPEIQYMHLYPDSLTNTNNFPLFETVKQENCMEVLYRPYSNVGNSHGQSLWKKGSTLNLNRAIRIGPGDVIEIRVVDKVNNDDDRGEKTIHADIREESDDELGNCVICMEGARDIVLRPCKHECICKVCYDTLIAKANAKKERPICPSCRVPITAFVYVHEWDVKKYGNKFNVTSNMRGLYGLLASLARYCV
jgi:hypothetical protein